MPAPDQTIICNLAMTRIAQRPIADIDDATSRQAKVLKGLWDACVRDTLRGSPWPFATIIKPLAVVSNYSPFAFQYAYGHPQVALAFWKVYSPMSLANFADIINAGGMGLSSLGSQQKPKGEPFRILLDDTNNQKVIVTDAYQAYGEYTIEVVDVTLFDANFVSALAYKLAAEACMPLQADPALAVSMANAFSKAISDAQRSSSAEDQTYQSPTSSYIDARD